MKIDPAATPRWTILLALAALLLADATVLTFATGRPLLAVAGTAACIGVHTAGHTHAARHYRPLLRNEHRLARTDRLTGLPNRIAVDDLLDDGLQLTIALLDVNGLHAINNSLGLAAGDRYLQTVAERLSQRDGARPLRRRRDVNPLADAMLAWNPEPGDELIPVLLSPADLRTLGQALKPTNQFAYDVSRDRIEQLAARLNPLPQSFTGPADDHTTDR